jgi:DNA polymerase gamma 1
MSLKLIIFRKAAKHCPFTNTFFRVLSSSPNQGLINQPYEAQCHRFNPLGIQLLSSSLYKQIFKDESLGHDKISSQDPSIAAAVHHLKAHGLWGKAATLLPDVDFKLPELEGDNIKDHFWSIASQQSEVYQKLLLGLVRVSLPPKPETWVFREGWTKYDASGLTTSVTHPEEDALIFDVEVCVQENEFPTLAVAASKHHWYSWCSERLTSAHDSILKNKKKETKRDGDMIPLEHLEMGHRTPKVVVGHNVAYDRSFVREQYAIDPSHSQARFVDTMSMHIANTGFTSAQRFAYNAAKAGPSTRKDANIDVKKNVGRRRVPVLHWMDESAPNSLKDLYSFYCNVDMAKDLRNTFVTGTIQDVRDDFQNLISYCADDVTATHQVSAAGSQLKQEFPNSSKRPLDILRSSSTWQMSSSKGFRIPSLSLECWKWDVATCLSTTRGVSSSKTVTKPLLTWRRNSGRWMP